MTKINKIQNVETNFQNQTTTYWFEDFGLIVDTDNDIAAVNVDEGSEIELTADMLKSIDMFHGVPISELHIHLWEKYGDN